MGGNRVREVDTTVIAADALRAGRACAVLREAPEHVEVLKFSKTKVLRLHLPAGRRVVAKGAKPGQLEKEVHLYSRLLPRLGIPTIELLGFSAAGDGGIDWLFLDDAGDEEYAPTDPAQRYELGTIVGERIAMAAAVGHDPELPDKGMEHYFDELTDSRRTIRVALDEHTITAPFADTLHRVLAVLDPLGDAWPSFCRGIDPNVKALVHCDIAAKNTRILSRVDAMRSIVLLDWELAAWASPAIDLGCQAGDRADAGDPFLVGYSCALARSDSTVTDVAHEAAHGRVLRLIDSVYWAVRYLPTTGIHRGIAYLDRYAEHLETALGHLELNVGRHFGD